MVADHIGFGKLISKFIHSFHMPMFFFISGFLTNQHKIKNTNFLSYLYKKCRTLLLPYVVVGLLHWFIYVLIYGYSLDPLINIFWNNNTDLPICNALWFLTALFISNILSFIIIKYINKIVLQIIIVFILSISGCLLYSKFGINLPFSLNQGLVGVGFIYTGFIINNYKHKRAINFIFKIPWWGLLIVIFFLCILVYINPNINMRTNSYTYILLFYINSIAASIVVLSISYRIISFITKHRLGKILFSVGENSIYYLCFNQIAILFYFTLLKPLCLLTFIQNTIIFL